MLTSRPVPALPRLLSASGMAATRLLRLSATKRVPSAPNPTPVGPMTSAAGSVRSANPEPMTVREIYADRARYTATGGGYDPAGAVLDASGSSVASPEHPPVGPLRDLFGTIALCNNATLQHMEGEWRVQGDPTEGALLTLAAKAGVSREEITSSHQVVKELPFDGDRKRMTIVALDEAGNEVVHSKGSADVLLPLCTDYQTDKGARALDDGDGARVLRHPRSRHWQGVTIAPSVSCVSRTAMHTWPTRRSPSSIRR